MGACASTSVLTVLTMLAKVLKVYMFKCGKNLFRAMLLVAKVFST